MTIGVYHKHWLLYSTDNETKAWEKAQKYSKCFSKVEVRKIASDTTSQQHASQSQ